MAIVFIPTLLRNLTGGRTSVSAEGRTVAEVIDALDGDWPGLRSRLCNGANLRGNLAVAVDGEVSPLGLREQVQPSSEIHFVAAIQGGSPATDGRPLSHSSTEYAPARPRSNAR